MPYVWVVCDRCQTKLLGYESDIATGGFYHVDGTPWSKYANEGEHVVCDACMFLDPRYQADYGKLAVAGDREEAAP